MRIQNLQALLAGGLLTLTGAAADGSCPDYSTYSKERHEPFSPGKYALSYQRPAPDCRTFKSPTVEALLANMTEAISDPDLYRLFENAYPNTLDTAIRWHGHAADNPDEELTFIITGDIDAMWLRDSSNQLQSYLPLLEPDPGADSIASLYRGVINLQARYLLTSPFCNSFQPPAESGIPPAENTAADSDTVFPEYDPAAVFECKYELDSLAAFLQISTDYHDATHDAAFFGKFQWAKAVRAVLATAKAMMEPTYGDDGAVLPSAYTFTRRTTRATETLANDGLGNPVARGTGLVRSAFRPSDDSTTLQFLVPANMMFSRYLGSAALIAAEIGEGGLADEMRALSDGLREAVTRHGIVPVAAAGADGTAVETVYAYEVDGYGSAVLMDDANIPSLLAAPFFGYLAAGDEVYQRTRRRLLDAKTNPYFMKGPRINAVGGPHVGPGMAWPMANIVRILTSDDDDEIVAALRETVSTTDGLGLIHEAVNSFDASKWTRQW